MLERLKSRTTASSAAGIGFALVSLTSLPMQAFAHGEHAAQAAPAGVASSANLTVVRDAETGLLRAPTAAELGAMQLRAAKSQSVRAAPAVPLQKFHISGARGARLTDDFTSHVIAVRKADGSVEEQCFPTKEAAQAALNPTVNPQSAAKLETE